MGVLHRRKPGAWSASHRYRPLEVIEDNGSCCALRKVPENVALGCPDRA
jgi:hypothetical protein